ncbi:MAG TPA: HAMP domain-containing sensor histidine kinase [Candidatus Dormibacteraeota bacterium]
MAASLVLLFTNGSVPTIDLLPLALLVVVAVATVDGTIPALISGLILTVGVGWLLTRYPGAFNDHGITLATLSILVAAMVAMAVLGGLPLRRVDRLRRSLQRQRQALGDATRSKSEFMDSAAHELRTPLTVINGYISMMEDETFGRLPDRLRLPIAAVRRKARELNALIDEMLLVARVQHGTAPAAAVLIDVREAVRQAVERAAPRVTLEHATLSYEVPSTPILCRVDPDHLGHILDNLISNALTYCDERPWVKVTVNGGSDARILVRDRGWGVPADMREKIFERFVHYVAPARKPKNGKGLGLALSRELAEHYGGSIDLVRSDVDKGSLFVVRLPAAAN